MPFNGVHLSGLRLSFPLPAHLDGKRAQSLAFSWELTRTIAMVNCSNVGLCATFGLMKAACRWFLFSNSVQVLFLGSVVSLFVCSSLVFSGTGTVVGPTTTVVVVFQLPIILLKMF